MPASKEDTLRKVRALLAKAEDEGSTQAEAEALTAKAAELMAKYGIDEALASARADKQEKPGNRKIDIANPWAQVKAHLLAGIAGAMRCQVVLLNTTKPGSRLHVFGFESDLNRADILYTSVLLQMAHAFTRAEIPASVRSVRAWRRSWLLGYVTAVIARVRAAESQAEARAKTEEASGTSTALVLADRSVQVRSLFTEAYPKILKTRITYSGRGYGDGYTKGQQANLHNQKSASGSSHPAIH